MEGLGKYKWSDGRIFEGEYKNDKKQGFGIYRWVDNREYQGNWSDGKQHGLGRYIVMEKEADGREVRKVKFGLWEDGKRI